MNKTFTSTDGTFIFNYPNNWKLEWEEDDTLLLYRKGNLFQRESQYSLRISSLLVAPKDTGSQAIPNNSTEIILNQLKEKYPDLQIINKDNFQVAKYKDDTVTEGDSPQSSIDVWILFTSNRKVICSFTTIKGEEYSTKAKEERAIAEDIIYSIKLF